MLTLNADADAVLTLMVYNALCGLHSAVWNGIESLLALKVSVDLVLILVGIISDPETLIRLRLERQSDRATGRTGAGGALWKLTFDTKGLSGFVKLISSPHSLTHSTSQLR